MTGKYDEGVKETENLLHKTESDTKNAMNKAESDVKKGMNDAKHGLSKAETDAKKGMSEAKDYITKKAALIKQNSATFEKRCMTQFEWIHEDMQRIFHMKGNKKVQLHIPQTTDFDNGDRHVTSAPRCQFKLEAFQALTIFQVKKSETKGYEKSSNVVTIQHMATGA